MDSLARVYGGIYTQMDRLNLIQEYVLIRENFRMDIRYYSDICYI